MNYIVGDLHGNKKRMLDALRKLSKGDRLFVCGDFSFVWEQIGTKEYYREGAFLDRLMASGIEILFVDGNHENFDRLNELHEEVRYGAPAGVVRPNILHLKRGYIYEIDNKKILAFGGATSTDKEGRIAGVSWWPEENHTYEDQTRAIDNLAKYTRTVDYIITHTAPRQAERFLQRLIDSQYGKTYFTLDDTTETRGLTELYNTAVFQEWHFGHLHVDGIEDRFHAHFTLVQQWF